MNNKIKVVAFYESILIKFDSLYQARPFLKTKLYMNLPFFRCHDLTKRGLDFT